MSSFPYLSVLTVAPLVGALVVAFLPRSRPELAKWLTLAWSLGILVLTVAMWLAFEPAVSGCNCASRTRGSRTGA